MVNLRQQLQIILHRQFNFLLGQYLFHWHQREIFIGGQELGEALMIR